jgi:hypothetical protein
MQDMDAGHGGNSRMRVTCMKGFSVIAQDRAKRRNPMLNLDEILQIFPKRTRRRRRPGILVLPSKRRLD